MTTYQDLSPEQGHAALGAEPTLRILDVRTEPEYLSHRIDGAQLIPVQELQQRIAELDPAQPYLVTCEHGIRSVMACEILTQAGFRDLRNLVGGMAEWVQQGLPAVQG